MKAYYDDLHVINLYSDIPVKEKIMLGETPLEIVRLEEVSGGWLYVLHTEQLVLGEAISLLIGRKLIRVQPRMIVKTPWFEDTYNAKNEKLGAWVENGNTHFAVWAPTAYSVFLNLDTVVHAMKRHSNGVFTLSLPKNLHGSVYDFSVRTHEILERTTDPYAKASLPNRSGSVVIDFTRLNLEVESLQSVDSPIICETHVRDFSMDPEVPFYHRGKFLGLLESHDNYGMKHLIDLGVTHIQLLPISDYETVDELNPFEEYNWGYDTMQYMVLEGSYSSDVMNPSAILEDFARLVDGYHKESIGVNMDMVFNHVYRQETHPLHILVPYYYFRYNEDYTLSDGSFCGNELATEMLMCRKLVLDTCEYFVSQFKIDGFRFDLMGLMDIKTIQELRSLLPDTALYGEGWHMPTVLKSQYCATLENQDKLPSIGFFNDVFRNTIGGALDGKDLGFAGDRPVKLEHVIASICGNSDPGQRPKMFEHSMQSINYVECHDNLTVADRVTQNNKDTSAALFMLGLVIMSQGTAFIQIGQSFFRDKKGDSNSYQSNDSINQVTWSNLDVYHQMNETVKSWIHIRKEMYRHYEGYSFKVDDATLRYSYGKVVWELNYMNKTITVNQY